MNHARLRSFWDLCCESKIWIANLIMLCVASLGAGGGCSGIQAPPQATDFRGPSGGCGNFFVYRFNETRTLAVTVQVDATALRAKGDKATLDLKSNAVPPRVQVLRFATPVRHYFCDDVDDGQRPAATWEAVAGRVEIQFHRPSEHQVENEALYDVSIELHEVELECQDRRQVAFLDPILIPQVQVGWFAG
jgi:hypothetical protein